MLLLYLTRKYPYIYIFYCECFLSSTYLVSSIVLYSVVFSIFVCSSFLTFSIDSTNYFVAMKHSSLLCCVTFPCDRYLLLIHLYYLSLTCDCVSFSTPWLLFNCVILPFFLSRPYCIRYTDVYDCLPSYLLVYSSFSMLLRSCMFSVNSPC